MNECFELKDDFKKTSSDDLYYDFFEGGYLNPEDFLKNKEDIDEVNKAKLVLEKYFRTIDAVVNEE